MLPGSAMVPFFGVKTEIVNEQGEILSANQGGLLVLTQPWPSMSTGIYQDPERFVEVYWKKFVDLGYYFTGDGAIKDNQGNITILGRVDDVINVSGHRLSTIEIENCLVSHSLVVEAAVIGFNHAIKGEAIACFVIPYHLKTNVTQAQELIEHIRQKIGSFAKPEIIRFTPALPKTRSGKIMRRLLKKIATNQPINEDISSLEDKSILEHLQNNL